MFVASHNYHSERTSNAIPRDINLGIVDRQVVPVPKPVVRKNVETIVIFESCQISFDRVSVRVGYVNGNLAVHVWLQAQIKNSAMSTNTT